MKRILAAALACLVLAGYVIHSSLPPARAAAEITRCIKAEAPTNRGLAPNSQSASGCAQIVTRHRPKPSARPDGTTPASARRLAQAMTASRGWNRGQEWRCLYRLWQRESGWRHNADNKHSSAYGIPQLLNLPEGTKPEKQIALGLKYVVSRYGAPCKAYAHQQEHGWY